MANSLMRKKKLTGTNLSNGSKVVVRQSAEEQALERITSCIILTAP